MTEATSAEADRAALDLRGWPDGIFMLGWFEQHEPRTGLVMIHADEWWTWSSGAWAPRDGGEQFPQFPQGVSWQILASRRSDAYEAALDTLDSTRPAESDLPAERTIAAEACQVIGALGSPDDPEVARALDCFSAVANGEQPESVLPILPRPAPGQAGVLCEVRSERARQDLKWGEQNHHPIEWISILTEEVGEAAKAALEAHFAGYDRSGDLTDYRAELIQVAAVAVAMVECLDRNRSGEEAHD